MSDARAALTAYLDIHCVRCLKLMIQYYTIYDENLVLLEKHKQIQMKDAQNKYI